MSKAEISGLLNRATKIGEDYLDANPKGSRRAAIESMLRRIQRQRDEGLDADASKDEDEDDVVGEDDEED